MSIDPARLSSSSSSSSSSSNSSSSSSLREFALCQIHDVLRHGHARGYTLDPSSRSTLYQARPGKAGRISRSCVLYWDFVAGNGAFFMLFEGFFQNLYYYAEIMGGQK